VRCYLYKDAQWPVERYIDGFKKLRVDRESLLVFGAIAGVPTDLIRTPVPPSNAAITPDYAGILADSRMRETLDTTPGTAGARLLPSCDVPGRGFAYPPRRIVEVARGFGANGIVQSICQESYAGALDAIIAKIADALGEVCLPRKLNPDATGLVRCDVLEVIPPPGTFDGQPTSCAELAGVNSMAKRTNADGSIECEVTQLSTAGVLAPEVPAGEGWYYEDLTSVADGVPCAGAQRIAFTAGAVPPNGIRVNLECLQRVQGSGGGSGTAIQVGTPCTPSNTSADPPAVDVCPSAAGMTLICEPRSLTCQISCATDADCPSSLVCDATSEVRVCRNPICVD
jgi:hypothetical protein